MEYITAGQHTVLLLKHLRWCDSLNHQWFFYRSFGLNFHIAWKLRFKSPDMPRHKRWESVALRTLKPAIMVVAIINSIFLINSSLITDAANCFLKMLHCLKRIANKFRREKHENLRDNCEYNTQWKTVFVFDEAFIQIK
jgi:hypothetical protein